jgi:tRNA A37 threonylcarbamoyladenosine dehydratase
LGQSVAFALARMGVAKILLLDMDYFEATNLNRQILGTVRDIGRRKVDVAEVLYLPLYCTDVYINRMCSARINNRVV